MNVILTFDAAAFRIQFPTFANPLAFPDSVLQMYWDQATCYMSNNSNDGYLNGLCRQLALNLLTAHLVQLSTLIAAGKTPLLVQNASIDKISVGLTPPPLKNQFYWWLSTTPYGMQLLALLQVKSVGGFYRGGLPEPTAIRKWGGIF